MLHDSQERRPAGGRRRSAKLDAVDRGWDEVAAGSAVADGSSPERSFEPPLAGGADRELLAELRGEPTGMRAAPPAPRAVTAPLHRVAAVVSPLAPPPLREPETAPVARLAPELIAPPEVAIAPANDLAAEPDLVQLFAMTPAPSPASVERPRQIARGTSSPEADDEWEGKRTTVRAEPSEPWSAQTQIASEAASEAVLAASLAYAAVSTPGAPPGPAMGSATSSAFSATLVPTPRAAPSEPARSVPWAAVHGREAASPMARPIGPSRLPLPPIGPAPPVRSPAPMMVLYPPPAPVATRRPPRSWPRRLLALALVSLVSIATGAGLAFFDRSATRATAPRTSSVHFVVEPADAHIAVDGVPAGPELELGAGSHLVVISRDGYRTWVTGLQVTAGADQIVRVPLVAVPAGDAR